LNQRRFLYTYPLCVAGAEVVVMQYASSALSVMDDRDLKPDAPRGHRLNDLTDEGEVIDHFGCNTPTYVADDHGVTQLETENMSWVDTGIEAGDDEQPQLGKYDRAAVEPCRSEGFVALKRGLESVEVRRCGTVRTLGACR
jgi:hypothetical protein